MVECAKWLRCIFISCIVYDYGMSIYTMEEFLKRVKK